MSNFFFFMLDFIHANVTSSLEVKGLAENRPSVLVGDYILVSHTGSGEDGTPRTWFEGRAHNVLLNGVSLRFGEEFSIYKGSLPHPVA